MRWPLKFFYSVLNWTELPIYYLQKMCINHKIGIADYFMEDSPIHNCFYNKGKGKKGLVFTQVNLFDKEICLHCCHPRHLMTHLNQLTHSICVWVKLYCLEFRNKGKLFWPLTLKKKTRTLESLIKESMAREVGRFTGDPLLSAWEEHFDR